jgi:hypothetical protein
VTLLFALAAFGAAAAQAPAAAPPPPQAKPAAEEKKICKREDMTGSRVAGKRVCRTKAQWDAITQQDQQALQEMTKLNPGVKGN